MAILIIATACLWLIVAAGRLYLPDSNDPVCEIVKVYCR